MLRLLISGIMNQHRTTNQMKKVMVQDLLTARKERSEKDDEKRRKRKKTIVTRKETRSSIIGSFKSHCKDVDALSYKARDNNRLENKRGDCDNVKK